MRRIWDSAGHTYSCPSNENTRRDSHNPVCVSQLCGRVCKRYDVSAGSHSETVYKADGSHTPNPPVVWNGRLKIPERPISRPFSPTAIVQVRKQSVVVPSSSSVFHLISTPPFECSCFFFFLRRQNWMRLCRYNFVQVSNQPKHLEMC